MKVFITGAGGYIGGTLAVRLIEQGCQVRGLTRNADAAHRLTLLGIDPVIGDLDDAPLLTAEAAKADVVVNAANADHRNAVEALIAGLSGSGKVLIHTSGTSLIGDDARGEFCAEAIFSEDTPLRVDPRKQARRDIDVRVLDSAQLNIRSAVIIPSLIYGAGAGLKKHSNQVPFLVQNAMDAGEVQIVGKGANTWSNVHIDDLVDLYLRVISKAPAGAFYFAENGEVSFAEVASALSARLHLPKIVNLAADDAVQRWGMARALFTFGSNCRVRAVRARQELGWTPAHASLQEWILSETELV
jgi:nucleoside-diphosphate-sugar epimerase